MLIDIEKLLDDFGISNTTSGKHSRSGWVQIECPLCTGNPGWHGGFNIARGYYNCWRCGWHTIEEVLAALTTQNTAQVKRLIKTYATDWIEEEDEEERPIVHKVEFPLGTGPLQKQHRKYLESRDFNAQQIEEEWDLLGTGPLGDYKFRIIAPVHFQGRIVSYQGRDITNRASLPYKACPMSHEVLHHKHTIYGIDKVTGDRLLLVEGIIDVWNVGPGAGATFGIDYTEEQVALLSKFKGTIFIMFDAEEEKAQEQAKDLSSQLYTSETVLLSYGDPGEMTPQEIVSLRKELKI